MSRKNGNGHSNEPRRAPKDAPPAAPLIKPEVKRELWALLWLAFAIIAGLSLFGSAGRVGRFLDDVLSSFFGLNRYLVPLITVGSTNACLLAADAILYRAEETPNTLAERGLLEQKFA